MARPKDRLNWKQVQGLREPGLHADGGGLYLRIDQTGNRRWVFIYHSAGRRREMGLGPCDDRKLAAIRDLADDARRIAKSGGDPIEARRLANAPAIDQTFSAIAEVLIDDLAEGWTSPKQKPIWLATLRQHAAAIWKADVATVDTEMVLTALRPIWNSKRETAQRVRGRIEKILDAAKARGLRSGENPARWKGHLENLLSSAQPERGHHAAMPYADVPAFVTRLATKSSVSAEALRFLIFTAARSGEVRGATWDEISGDVWSIPGSRMKAGKDHRVPLSGPARAVLNSIPLALRQGLIFPGLNGPMSDMTLTSALKKRGVTDVTVHGFRSSFRDWAGDCTSYPREVIEQALAHTIQNKAERAYRRSDALDKRRDLMNAWGNFCTGAVASNIHQLRA